MKVDSPAQVGGFYADFKQLIEEAVLQNGQKAVLISHSLGCPTTHYFLTRYVDSDWRKAHIESFIPMSGPWSGGVIQMYAYIYGSPFPLLPKD